MARAAAANDARGLGMEITDAAASDEARRWRKRIVRLWLESAVKGLHLRTYVHAHSHTHTHTHTHIFDWAHA